MCTSLQQSLQSSNRSWKHVLAFDSLCGAETGVGKHVLVFDSLCRAQMGVGKCVLAFDTLWTGLVIVCLCELWYYGSKF